MVAAVANAMQLLFLLLLFLLFVNCNIIIVIVIRWKIGTIALDRIETCPFVSSGAGSFFLYTAVAVSIIIIYCLAADAVMVFSLDSCFFR
jgi:hypothetical protein